MNDDSSCQQEILQGALGDHLLLNRWSVDTVNNGLNLVVSLSGFSRRHESSWLPQVGRSPHLRLNAVTCSLVEPRRKDLSHSRRASHIRSLGSGGRWKLLSSRGVRNYMQILWELRSNSL